MDARKYLAELVGTFILVVVGSMTIVARGDDARRHPALRSSHRSASAWGCSPRSRRGLRLGRAFQPGGDPRRAADRRIDAMNAVGYVVAQVDRRHRGIRRDL